MNAHTPGPWTIEFARELMGKGRHHEPYASPESEANARLIAAAPDLAEALQDLLHALESTVHGQIDIRAAEARAALAKAGL